MSNPNLATSVEHVNQTHAEFHVEIEDYYDESSDNPTLARGFLSDENFRQLLVDQMLERINQQNDILVLGDMGQRPASPQRTQSWISEVDPAANEGDITATTITNIENGRQAVYNNPVRSADGNLSWSYETTSQSKFKKLDPKDPEELFSIIIDCMKSYKWQLYETDNINQLKIILERDVIDICNKFFNDNHFKCSYKLIKDKEQIRDSIVELTVDYTFREKDDNEKRIFQFVMYSDSFEIFVHELNIK